MCLFIYLFSVTMVVTLLMEELTNIVILAKLSVRPLLVYSTSSYFVMK